MGRQRSQIAAGIYNRSRLLLGRSSRDCRFVPIRSMQYQGVIAPGEIVFVDAQGYAVRDGQGGRLIVLAWQMVPEQSRDSLTDPVAIDLVYYHPTAAEAQRRLIGEFGKAMDLLLGRDRDAAPVGDAMRVVSIRGG
jgi:hypothetical protein